MVKIPLGPTDEKGDGEQFTEKEEEKLTQPRIKD